MRPKVDSGINAFLEQPFCSKGNPIKLSQMCLAKALGLDILQAIFFFQKPYKAIKRGVITTCLYVLNQQGTITPLNNTYIALITKVVKPRKIIDYRPINLCNIIFRLIAKAITNRLKQILHHIISPMQSAFDPNRLITYNIIISYECLHKIKHNKGKNKGNLHQ